MEKSINIHRALRTTLRLLLTSILSIVFGAIATEIFRLIGAFSPLPTASPRVFHSLLFNRRYYLHFLVELMNYKHSR